MGWAVSRDMETLEAQPGKGQLSAVARPEIWDEWDKKYLFWQNEPEKLLKTKDRCSKTNRNEAKNEAEKLLKTLECIKNEPERTEKRTGPNY